MPRAKTPRARPRPKERGLATTTPRSRPGHVRARTRRARARRPGRGCFVSVPRSSWTRWVDGPHSAPRASLLQQARLAGRAIRVGGARLVRIDAHVLQGRALVVGGQPHATSTATTVLVACARLTRAARPQHLGRRYGPTAVVRGHQGVVARAVARLRLALLLRGWSLRDPGGAARVGHGRARAPLARRSLARRRARRRGGPSCDAADQRHAPQDRGPHAQA